MPHRTFHIIPCPQLDTSRTFLFILFIQHLCTGQNKKLMWCTCRMLVITFIHYKLHWNNSWECTTWCKSILHCSVWNKAPNNAPIWSLWHLKHLSKLCISNLLLFILEKYVFNYCTQKRPDLAFHSNELRIQFFHIKGVKYSTMLYSNHLIWKSFFFIVISLCYKLCLVLLYRQPQSTREEERIRHTRLGSYKTGNHNFLYFVYIDSSH